MAAQYPAISDPTVDPGSLRDSILALKQGFEILTGQRGDGSAAAVTKSTLPATTSTTSSTTTSSAPFEAESYNNILINGGMEVDQINQGAATTGNAVWVVDQWYLSRNGTMATTAQQVSDAPPGFSNSLKITVTTAEASIAAGDYVILSNSIEGFRTSRLQFGTANALPVTIGFWTKTHRIGTYSGSLINYASTRGYAFSFTQNVADTWEYKTVTVPGDVAGTWVGNTNAASLVLIITMASGTTHVGAANTWGSTAFYGVTGTTNGVAATTDVFQISGVSLLPGSVAPTAGQSALIKRTYADELALSQRYFWTSLPNPYNPAVTSNAYAGGLNVSATMSFPVVMRATPTLAFVGSWTASNCSSFSAWVAGTKGFSIYAVSLAVGNVSYYPGAANVGITADARL